MKDVKISLSDEHAALIDAEIGTGDFASISDVINAALDDYFGDGGFPSVEQMLADAAAVQAEIAAGGKMYSAEEALQIIRGALRR